MLPRVIMHIGVSVDGRLDWGLGEESPYYELTSHWKVDAMLSGSNTMLAANISAEVPEETRQLAEQLLGKPNGRQLLVIVDSRGRIRNWHAIRRQPWWRDAISLCSAATPPDHLEYLRQQGVATIVAGDDHVDLKQALETLHARYGIKIMRIDSGGILNGALLRAGLVDEVGVLIGPALVGGMTPRTMFVAPDLSGPDGVIKLRLLGVEEVRQTGYVWLRYEVIKS